MLRRSGAGGAARGAGARQRAAAAFGGAAADAQRPLRPAPARSGRAEARGGEARPRGRQLARAAGCRGAQRAAVASGGCGERVRGALACARQLRKGRTRPRRRRPPRTRQPRPPPTRRPTRRLRATGRAAHPPKSRVRPCHSGRSCAPHTPQLPTPARARTRRQCSDAPRSAMPKTTRTLAWKARPAASFITPTTADALLRATLPPGPAGAAPGVHSRYRISGGRSMAHTREERARKRRSALWAPLLRAATRALRQKRAWVIEYKRLKSMAARCIVGIRRRSPH